jgi:hypothetical protein
MSTENFNLDFTAKEFKDILEYYNLDPNNPISMLGLKEMMKDLILSDVRDPEETPYYSLEVPFNEEEVTAISNYVDTANRLMNIEHLAKNIVLEHIYNNRPFPEDLAKENLEVLANGTIVTKDVAMKLVAEEKAKNIKGDY